MVLVEDQLRVAGEKDKGMLQQDLGKNYFFAENDPFIGVIGIKSGIPTT